ncbi:hypothetical protein [Nocardia sp. NPDC057353]|uniref:hypothetical protein n=1 Tax=Nocardia sp. NPDC057353 TaxID=3346104 RepID=UPI00362D48D1
MLVAPTGSDFDRADQHICVDPADRDTGLDPTAVFPPTERIRSAVDTAPIADRLDQAWILPADDDLYSR